MKIFVSYSRADGSSFAKKVDKYFTAESQDVFTDVDDIKGGDPWSTTIEENITDSDIFIVILTFGALKSAQVEKEVLLAKNANKKIIPAKYENIRFDEVPWGLDAHQGIEFESQDEIVTRLYEKIFDRKPPIHNQNKSSGGLKWIVIFIVASVLVLSILPFSPIITPVILVIVALISILYIKKRRQAQKM